MNLSQASHSIFVSKGPFATNNQFIKKKRNFFNIFAPLGQFHITKTTLNKQNSPKRRPSEHLKLLSLLSGIIHFKVKIKFFEQATASENVLTEFRISGRVEFSFYELGEVDWQATKKCDDDHFPNECPCCNERDI
jgi:hypothetical protein